MYLSIYLSLSLSLYIYIYIYRYTYISTHTPIIHINCMRQPGAGGPARGVLPLRRGRGAVGRPILLLLLLLLYIYIYTYV